MMKFFFLCLISFSVTTVVGQQSYKKIQRIKYYPSEAYKNDRYKDSMCVLDLYYPEHKKDFATIVWLHGGGITGGHRDLPEALQNKGYAIATVEYRLSPRVKAPQYIEDAAAAVAWVFKHIKEYGGDDRLIFLSGHSAGAYLVSMVTLNKNYLAQHDIDANRIAALVPFSSQAITHFTVRQERGVDPLRPVIDSLAPLHFVRKDAPPTIILTGDRELEMMGRYEENAYWFRMMKLVGHTRSKLFELEGYDHGNMPLGGYPLLLNAMKQRIKEINAEKK